MELMEAIKKRRAIRKFKPDPVPEGMFRELLDAARLAPSGVNAQPWKFKVVTEPGVKEQVFLASRNQFHIRQAPAVIVICADTMAMSKGMKARFKELLDNGIITQEDLNKMGLDVLTEDEVKDLDKYAVSASFNTAIATEHIALMAAALGLGTCWIHLFGKEKVAKLFNLPPWIIPVTLMPVGYADEDPEPRPRKSIEEVTF
jgi:nitroreductase